MSEQQSQQRPSRLKLWRDAGLIWFGLWSLFAVNVFLAYVPLGGANVPVHMSVAFLMMVLLVGFFMDFKEHPALLRLAAFAGVFWLIFMFVLTASDYFTRQ
jgi:cytochrome c oxidase subunit 4